MGSEFSDSQLSHQLEVFGTTADARPWRATWRANKTPASGETRQQGWPRAWIVYVEGRFFGALPPQLHSELPRDEVAKAVRLLLDAAPNDPQAR